MRTIYVSSKAGAKGDVNVNSFTLREATWQKTNRIFVIFPKVYDYWQKVFSGGIDQEKPRKNQVIHHLSLSITMFI